MVCEGWEGNTVDGKFPLLEWLGGWADRCVFLTVRQGTQKANIKLILASGEDADAHLTSWEGVRALPHPFLVQLMENGRYTIHGSEVVYLVTEKADAFLSAIIPRKALGPAEVKAILDPILDALEFLHEKGITHGSVKPANIVQVGEQWKLSSDEMAGSGGNAKTARKPDGYDAPEVAEGKLSPAADMWSLGIITVEAFAQRTPVWDPGAKADLGVPGWVMPEPFREMARGCLRWDPADRISIKDAKALLARPTAFPAAAESATPPPVVPPPEPVEKKEAAPFSSEPRDSFREQEPVEFAPRSRLFSNVEDDEEHTGRKGSIFVAFLVLLAIVAVVAWRGFRGRLFPAHETQNAPAASQTSPPVPPSETGSSQPAPANASQPDSTPTQAGAPSAPQSGAAESKSTPPQPETLQPETPVTAPAKKPAEPAQSAKSAQANSPSVTKPESSPPEEASTPQVANSKGAVLKRVLPNVEPGATGSMRRAVDVELRVAVNEEGSVSNVEYMTQGPGNYFARKSRQAAQSWKFKPPQSDGQAVASRWVLLFRFERRKVDVTATQLR